MHEGVDEDRHERDEEDAAGVRHLPGATAAVEEDQPDREERREDATGLVGVDRRAEEEAEHERLAELPAARLGAVEGEEEGDDHERLQCNLEDEPADLEQPRAEAGERGRGERDQPAAGDRVGEHVEEQHRRESDHGAEDAGDLDARPRDAEDGGEEVDVERALVVPERPDEERQRRPVLVLQARRERVGVVGDRRLVPVEPGRVLHVDVQEDDGDQQEDADHEEPLGGQSAGGHEVRRLRSIGGRERARTIATPVASLPEQCASVW